MAYRRLGTETGTEPIKCKINERHVAYIESHDLIFNAVVNLAVYNLVHDLQTDKLKATWQMQQGSRASRWHGDKNIVKAARVCRDLLEYLRMNCYNVNGSINLALTRLIVQWDGNETKAGFSYPVGVTKSRKEPSRGGVSQKTVCPKLRSATNHAEEPTKPDVSLVNKDIQYKKVRYLGDPCKHAKWIEGLTPDMCGHCEYFDHTITDHYESYCMYHGKR